MPKAPKIKIDRTPVVDLKPEADLVEEVKAAKDNFPKVDSKGRFVAIPFEGGFVIYNPAGQRVSGIMNKVQADDMVRNQNLAAHIK